MRRNRGRMDSQLADDLCHRSPDHASIGFHTIGTPTSAAHGMKLMSLLLWAGLAFIGLLVAVRAIRARADRQRRDRSAASGSSVSSAPSPPLIIGFFHPFCNSGGGGERVLWQYVRILQAAFPQALIQIYTGDAESSEEILRKTLSRFGLAVSPTNLSFVRLRTCRLVEASTWPRFTMIGQSLGSMILAFEALWRAPPHLFIDTTGFAFTYPVASLGFGCVVHAYTHYPTISNEMLEVVWNRRAAHNNDVGVAGGSRMALLLARVKWIYYKCFALSYSLVGSQASLVFCNSTWTRNHMDSCWARKAGSGLLSSWGLPAGAIQTVYPPCDTLSLQQIPTGRVRTWAETLAEGAAPVNVSASDDRAAKAILSLSAGAAPEPYRENLIVSLAQFRPEKDHSLQLRAFALFLKQLRELAAQSGANCPKVSLVLVGGVRDDGDAARVEALHMLAADLHISDAVSIRVNQPLSVVHELLSKALVGMHTMWNEHFGIGVVEFMAAGVIPLAHKSAGPLLDIVVPHFGAPASASQAVGFLATDAKSYAAALLTIFASEEFRGSAAMQSMRRAARVHAASFSDQQFEAKLNELFVPFIENMQPQSSQRSRSQASKNKRQ